MTAPSNDRTQAAMLTAPPRSSSSSSVIACAVACSVSACVCRTLPPHINFNRLKIIATRQAWSAFAIDYDELGEDLGIARKGGASWAYHEEVAVMVSYRVVLASQASSILTLICGMCAKEWFWTSPKKVDTRH